MLALGRTIYGLCCVAALQLTLAQSCASKLTIGDSRGTGSGDSTAPDPQVVGIPTGASSESTFLFGVTYDADSLVAYSYKISDKSKTACASEDAYSEEISAKKKTTIDVSNLADGSLYLCIIARNRDGKWQDPTAASIVTWIKDTVPPKLALDSQPGAMHFRGDAVELDFTASDASSGIKSIAIKYSANGSDFGEATALAADADSLTYTLPSTLASAATAKLRLIATDEADNSTEVDSDAFRVATQIRLLTGNANHVGNAEGSGTTAMFGAPGSVVSDGTYLYMYGGTNFIASVKISDGTTEYLVGKPWYYDYADGTGAEALMTTATGLAVVGNYLYFADYAGHTIRRVNINRLSANFRDVTTVAGLAWTSGTTDDTGSLARFSSPRHLCPSSDNTILYVSDYANNRIRAVNLSTFTVSTLAGSTSGYVNNTGTLAKFSAPEGCVVTGGYLYVSDAGNRVIRKIDVSTGAATTFLGHATTAGIYGHYDGSGAATRFGHTMQLTTDGTYIYTVDRYFHTVRRIDIAGTSVSTIAGSSGDPGYVDGTLAASRFFGPNGITLVGTKLYVGEWASGSIRTVDLTNSVVSTLNGPYKSGGTHDYAATGPIMGGAGVMSPWGFIDSADGNTIYFTDEISHTVRAWSKTAGTVTTIAGVTGEAGYTNGQGTAARFNSPTGIVRIGTNLFVAEYYNHCIRKIDLSNSNDVTQFAGTCGTSGTTEGVVGTGKLSGPIGMATDGTTIYVADYNNSRIRAVSNVGTLSLRAGGAVSFADGDGAAGLFRYPYDVALSSDNSLLYITDSSNYLIRQMTTAPPYTVSTLAGSLQSAGHVDDTGTSAKFSSALHGIAADATYLYIADTNNYAIRRLKFSDNSVTTLAGSSSYTTLSTGYSGTTNGEANKDVFLLDATTLLYAPFNSGVGLMTLDLATLTNSFVINNLGHEIGNGYAGWNRSGKDGTISTTWRSSYWQGVSDGTYIYASDKLGQVIHRISLATGASTVFAGQLGQGGAVNAVGAAARFNEPEYLAIDQANGYLYVADGKNNAIRRVDINTATVTTIAGGLGLVGASTDANGTSARFKTPKGLALGSGVLYVGDSGNSIIRAIDLGTNQVSTIAGISGSSGWVDGDGLSVAKFSGIRGLQLVGRNLYVGGGIKYVVRKINLDTSVVSTPFGAGYGYKNDTGNGALLYGPEFLTYDGKYLYIGDRWNGVIRRADLDTSVVTTVVGTPFQFRGTQGTTDLSGATLSDPQGIVFIPGKGLALFSGSGIYLVE